MDLDLFDCIDRGVEIDSIDQGLAGNDTVKRDPLIGIPLAIGAHLRCSWKER